MDPITIITLIAKVGIPAAQEIIALVRSKQQPTADDWNTLLTKLAKPYDQYIVDAQKLAGIVS